MQKITLDEWAAAEFKVPPSLNTLRRWAREGLIFPAPIKHGRNYYVEIGAQYREPELRPVQAVGGSLISRIGRARHVAQTA